MDQLKQLRLDMDVLDRLKRKGPGYPTEINAILRRVREIEASKQLDKLVTSP